MNLRKIDYIIVFITAFSFLGIQLTPPILAIKIFYLFIVAVIVSIIIGTISNYIIKRRDS